MSKKTVWTNPKYKSEFEGKYVPAGKDSRVFQLSSPSVKKPITYDSWQKAVNEGGWVRK